MGYDSTRVNNDHFEELEGISKILRTIPANKLKPLDDVPLPTGLHTKIGWLLKLVDIIAEDLNIHLQELQVLDLEVPDDVDDGDGDDFDDEIGTEEMKREIAKNKEKEMMMARES